MMAAFNVTALLDLGYNETAFRDPMEGRWRAEAVTAAKFTPAAITAKVQFMAGLKPYSDVDDVDEALGDYLKTHNKRAATGAGPIKLRRRMMAGEAN